MSVPPLVVAGLVLIGVVVIARVTGIARSPHYFLLSIALFAGSISVTLEETRLSATLASLSGSAPFELSLQAVLAVFAMTSVMCWANLSWQGLSSWASFRQWRWLMRLLYPWFVTVPVCVALVVIAFGSDLSLAQTYRAVGEFRADDAQMLFLGLYEGLLTVYFVTIITTFALLGRRSARKWLSIGYWTLAITTIVCMARSVYTLAYVVPQVVGMDVTWPWSETFTVYANFPGYVVGFVGTLLPALDDLGPQRELRVVTPLWRDLKTANGEHLVRVDVPADTIGNEVIARDTVILEGLRWLKEISTPNALALIREQLIQAHVPEERLDAATYAAWIGSVLAQHDPSQSHPITPDDAWPLNPGEGQLAWRLDMCRLYSRAFAARRWPWRGRVARAIRNASQVPLPSHQPAQPRLDRVSLEDA
ncbi:hypothetical protein ACIBHX_46700 [Nonomuraea sp. NPDC050536]|uniref:hypothetical protein n=1 Tax=Nonomuraea sp. NPDC050536 TaxID=3364366 RepID=UPI0037CA65C4